MEELIERLKARAADPERRTDTRPSVFTQRLGGMDLDGLLRGLRQSRADLDRAEAASRSGHVDPVAHAAALDLEAQMRTPADTDLPAPADAQTVTEAERRIAVSLPPFLRRLYTEVADGGFGPSEGLVPLARMTMRYEELQMGEELPRGRSWPAGLLPVVGRDPGWDCVEASTGRVVAWDPEGLSERSGDAAFRRSFSAIAPSVEEWFGAWVSAETFEERMARQVVEANLKAAREARARIGAMTPEQRAQMGLPEDGWERVVWGGLGLEEEEPS